jgi:hypothetical protein
MSSERQQKSPRYLWGVKPSRRKEESGSQDDMMHVPLAKGRRWPELTEGIVSLV